MAKPDRTPWEPGVIALGEDEVTKPNPYTGKVPNPLRAREFHQAIGITCYQVDCAIAGICRVSNN